MLAEIDRRQRDIHAERCRKGLSFLGFPETDTQRANPDLGWRAAR